MTQSLHQMFERYGSALGAEGPVVVLFVGLALVGSFVWMRAVGGSGPSQRGSGSGRNRWLLGCAVSGGVAWGMSLAWLGDDAFISFRYAENLANGQGLVFNPGERVEGYTNFLWTLVLAGFAFAGLDPPTVSLALSLVSFGALIALVPRVLRTAHPDFQKVGVGVAAFLVAAQYTLASFATSGLETMLAAMLSLLAIERAQSRAPLASGAAGVAAALAHPDHGILYAVLGVALGWDRGRRRELFRYGLPFVLVYLPYFLWRWNYYGSFFPNTYYAKSGDLWYLSQGGLYVASFLIGSGLWLSLPLILFGIARLRGVLLGRYLMIAVPVFLLYVAKIGGDFMYGRLLCPLLAPLFVAAEVGLRTLFVRRRWGVAAVALCLLALTAVPTRIFAPGEKKWHISDERTFYPLVSFFPLEVESRYFRWARSIDRHLRSQGVDPRIALECVGTVGYYTGLPVIDTLGLTDAWVARRPIRQRGRPGHEKRAPIPHVFARGAELSDRPLYPKPYAEWTRLPLDRFDFFLARFDPAWLERLRGATGARLAALKARVDGFVASEKAGQSAEDLACDAWFFDWLVAEPTDSTGLRLATESALLEAGRIRRVLGDPERVSGELRATHRPEPGTSIRFDEPSKDATHFRRVNVPDASVDRWIQTGMAGWEGGVLTTRTGEKGEVATIHLRSEPFEIVGDVLEFSLAGGRNVANLSVSLWVDGARRFAATGCGSELPGRRLWWTAPFVGRQAVVEVVDTARGRGAHLVIDEIVQWVPRDSVDEAAL
ncbi:hypothetical protein MK489_08295 [Myxococcota bacterium]|nr:hypothetical protein [Myxococcota bacterium]